MDLENLEEPKDSSIEEILQEVRKLMTGSAERSEIALRLLQKSSRLTAEAEEMEREADALMMVAEHFQNLELSAIQNKMGGTARGDELQGSEE